MNKKISLGAAIAYMAIVAAVAVSVTIIWSMNKFDARVNSLSQREAMYEKISEVDRLVRSSYYGTLDEEALRDSTAEGYLAGMGDPYARYFTAMEYEAYTQGETGQYVGIGVVTELDSDGYIRIKEVYSESPAEVAGLLPGDLIISVDGETATAENYETLVGAFRGEAGTKITLVQRRDNEETPLEITRRSVDVPTVTSTLLDGGMGYIRFASISSATPSQFNRAVNELVSQGAAALIFDIRGIVSDQVEYITEMLDILLPKGVIAYAEYRDGQREILAESDEKDISLPMMVLTDGDTKGTIELFAQALRDTGKARTVGTMTFGKGTRQEATKLKDGSAILITVAKYAGPLGTTYDQVGVIADYDVRWSLSAEERAALVGDPNADPVLKKAVELLNTAVKTENNLVASGQ